MCRVIQVSRSGYYEWLNNPEGNRAKKDKNLILRKVEEIMALELSKKN